MCANLCEDACYGTQMEIREQLSRVGLLSVCRMALENQPHLFRTGGNLYRQAILFTLSINIFLYFPLCVCKYGGLGWCWERPQWLFHLSIQAWFSIEPLSGLLVNLFLYPLALVTFWYLPSKPRLTRVSRPMTFTWDLRIWLLALTSAVAFS